MQTPQLINVCPAVETALLVKILPIAALLAIMAPFIMALIAFQFVLKVPMQIFQLQTAKLALTLVLIVAPKQFVTNVRMEPFC
jgi:hypothetical protein